MRTMIFRCWVLLIIFNLFGLLQSCNTSNKKQYKKNYYSSSKLKDEGWYIHDSIPVDSIFRYYENGNIDVIERRDDSGYLAGITSFYYENGRLESLGSFVEGLAQGFNTRFYRTGGISEKTFWYHGMSVGDAYFYDSLTGNIDAYRYFDFLGNTINLTDYDSSTGKITKNILQEFYTDSIKEMNKKEDSIKGDKRFDILLIISNPPKCKTNITIEYKAKNILLMRDTVPSGPYYYIEKIVPNSVDSINYLGSLYDSLQQITFYYDVVQPVAK
jgi:hypothetical protein